MSCLCLAPSRPLRTSRQRLDTPVTPVTRPQRLRPAAAAGGGGGLDDAGAAFAQRFRSLADALPARPPADSGSGGCCGGSSASSGAAESAAGSGCCGGSGAGASGQSAAGSVQQLLNSMMSGMDGTLTREDFQAALQAAPASLAAGDGGERLLDVASILRGGGQGAGGSEGDELDDELDALVV